MNDYKGEIQIMKKKEAKIVSKKPIFIILGLIFILVGIIVFLNWDKFFKPKKESTMEEKNKIEVQDHVVIDAGSILDLEIFFLEKIDLNEAKITFTNQDETTSNKDLILEENLVSSIGKFDVKIEFDGETYYSVLEVVDKTSPILEVKDIEMTEGDEITIDSFVVSCEDNSKATCKIQLLDVEGNGVELDTSIGTRKYMIVASDDALNETKKEVSLHVIQKAPVDNGFQNEPSINNSNLGNVTEKETNTENKEGSNPPAVTIVSTRNETEETYEDFKYGTKYKVINIYLITTYSNEVVDKKLVSTNKELDTSGFKATSKELESEARSVSNSSYGFYQEVTKYVNEYRTEAGVEPLSLDNELSVLATIRAIEMAYADTFSHTRPDGRYWGSVGDDMDFEKMIFAENIAYGTGGYNGTPQKVATSWKNSPGHYSNMIASGHKTIGVGTYTLNGTTYWVQLFCG